MTNKQIVAIESQRLAEEGILKYTGKTYKAINAAGEEITVKEVQPIHTYAGWQEIGYQVKKGQKSKVKFPIWKYTSGKKKGMTEEEAQEKGYCFLKLSAWFTDEQVEPIESGQA